MEIFNFLNENNINYVVWKNSNLINEFFEGKENLDILIDYDEDELDSIFLSYGWIEIKKVTINHERIKHYYFLAEEKRLHIHIYFDLITGDSIAKDYVFNKDLIIKNFFYDKKYRIKILDYDIQKYLFFIRLIIKNSSFFGYFLFKRQLRYFHDEFIFLNHHSKKIKNVYDFPNKLLNKINELSLKNIFIPNLLSIKLFLYLIKKNRRINFFHKNFIIVQAILKNIFFKKILKKKDKLLNSKFVAIIGPDGSGKSTLVKYMKNYFNFLDIKTYHIAKPYPYLILLLIIYYKKYIKKNNNIKINGLELTDKNNNIIFLLKSIFLAFLRYRVSKKIQKDLKKGNLVISDRYISNKVGDINGPRIIRNDNFMVCIFSKIENYFYSNIHICEFAVILNASLEVCLKRNKNRIKPINKNSDEITNRYNLFTKSNFKVKNKFFLDNNIPYNILKTKFFITMLKILCHNPKT